LPCPAGAAAARTAAGASAIAARAAAGRGEGVGEARTIGDRIGVRFVALEDAAEVAIGPHRERGDRLDHGFTHEARGDERLILIGQLDEHHGFIVEGDNLATCRTHARWQGVVDISVCRIPPLHAHAALPVDILLVVVIDLQARDDRAAMVEEIDLVSALDMRALQQIHDVGFIDLAIGEHRGVADARCVVGHVDRKLVHAHHGDAVVRQLDAPQTGGQHEGKRQRQLGGREARGGAPQPAQQAPEAAHAQFPVVREVSWAA